jgi:hypothetical protein
MSPSEEKSESVFNKYLPEAISRRSLRDKVTVQPLPKIATGLLYPKYRVEDPLVAAERDIEEMLADPVVKSDLDVRQFMSSHPEHVLEFYFRRILPITAIAMRSVIESERAKILQLKAGRLKWQWFGVVAIFTLLILLQVYRLLMHE